MTQDAFSPKIIILNFCKSYFKFSSLIFISPDVCVCVLVRGEGGFWRVYNCPYTFLESVPLSISLQRGWIRQLCLPHVTPQHGPYRLSQS